MKLTAIMPARNEAWVLGLSLRAVALWVDEVVVLNHASTDRTADICREVADETGKVHVIDEADGVWREMAHRQRLLTEARSRGATHIALVDADEVLTGNLVLNIRDHIAKLPPGSVLQTAMACMWRSMDNYREDGSVWSMTTQTSCSLGFCDAPQLRWEAQQGYDHHHRHPIGSRVNVRVPPAFGGVMHLQFANWRRLRAKHALYKMTERVRWPQKRVADIDQMYNMALDETRLRLVHAPDAWWDPYRQWTKHVDFASEPWHEAECARLWAEHGREMFRGLNLFGVVQ